MKLLYDIIPPQIVKERRAEKIENAFLRVVSLLLVIGILFNWAGFSKIIDTVSYLSDTENSSGNLFTAGALDFVLGSPDNFTPPLIKIGESATRDINFLNIYNFPKYQVKADNFSGGLCDYLILEASLDGGIPVSMPLASFISDIVDFSDPDLWSFKLTLPADAPTEEVNGQNCQFKFVFFGSQIKNDLPFGLGFNDIEEIDNYIMAEHCEYFEIKSHGYWKNHPEVYALLLPQTLGDYVVDTTTKANAVFVECGGLNMSDKLRCQLLAMKFNIAKWGIGDYWVESEGKTLNEIVAEADDLLIYPFGTPCEKEAMKDLLDYLNNLGEIEICGIGGEQPMLVINKVYYDVDVNHGAEEDNEIVELYNPGFISMDISNWIISDDTSEDVLPDSLVIPGFGFVIITGNSSTFDYWDIPDDVIKIVLSDGKIGNGLDNDSDRVILKNSEGLEVDAMSYGTDIYAFEPACPDVDEGHMLGRYPNGFDTDTADDWKDYALPSIHIDYPNGGEVWYVGQKYIIRWTAVNPSGSDSDILINLYYSADSGSTWASIVKATENDGQYKWRVPLFIGPIGTGYYVPSHNARIKAVARNINNFIVSDWDMTDEDFCPPIDYDLLTPEEAAYLMSLDGYLYSPESGEEDTVIEEIVNSVDDFVSDLFEEEEPAQNPEDIEADPPACEICGGEPLLETPVDSPIDEETIQEDNDEAVILGEDVVVPETDNSTTDNENSDE